MQCVSLTSFTLLGRLWVPSFYVYYRTHSSNLQMITFLSERMSEITDDHGELLIPV